MESTLKNNWAFVLFLFWASTWWACGTAQSKMGRGGEGFTSFYQRFHKDSLFQHGRVLFPLDGYSIEGGQINPWQRERWVMHKNGLEQIDTTIYRTERLFRGDLVRERIYQPQSGVLIERHFKLIDRKWWLSFYLYVFL